MNYFTKYFALLLAGLLTTASLFSCASTTDPAAQSADAATTAAATTTAPTTDTPITCLSPTNLKRKMLDATEFTLRYTQWDKMNGKEYEFSEIINRKGDKVMITYINQNQFGLYSEKKYYYDLENALYYEKDENDKWVAAATDAKWASIINGVGLEELLDPANMKKKGDHYEFPAAKAKEWRDSHGFNGSISIQLTEKDGVHTVRIEYLDNPDGDERIETFTIEFNADSIRLPSVR